MPIGYANQYLLSQLVQRNITATIKNIASRALLESARGIFYGYFSKAAPLTAPEMASHHAGPHGSTQRTTAGPLKIARLARPLPRAALPCEPPT